MFYKIWSTAANVGRGAQRRGVPKGRPFGMMMYDVIPDYALYYIE